MKWMREWCIEPVGVKTDHNLVSVLMTTPSAPVVGKGRPVFPLHLLKDKKLTKLMKQEGLSAIQELNDLEHVPRTPERNAQTVLMKLKNNWMTIARKYEKTIVPKLVKEIALLEERARVLQNMGGILVDERAEEIGTVMTQLRQLKAK